jgi:hypothetical protein
MNRNHWTTLQHRLGCAAAAALASTLILSGVLWLFAGAAGPSATPPQVLVTADGRVDMERARVR